MSAEAGRISEPRAGYDKPIFIGVGTAAAAAVVVWAAMLLAGGQEVGMNPFSAVIGLATGDLAWSTATTVWLAALVVMLLVPVVVAWRSWSSKRGQRTRVDGAQRHLGSGRDIESLRRRSVESKSRSLGVTPDVMVAPFTTWAGVRLGRRLGSQEDLLADWEAMHLDIWGPRQGKSTSRIIPAICEAPGAVLTTENKRGNLDHTRLVREFRDEAGNPTRAVWVFDPQAVANEPASWWWNPLSYVRGETEAEELAGLFAAGDDGQEAKKDPYFDPEGQDLLANLILASALGGEPITTVYKRLVDLNLCRKAVAILDQHDYPMIALALNARLNLPDKQKMGIVGTAQNMARCLRNQEISKWITDDSGARPHLDLETYVRQSETLYCLSKEGVGSAGPIVAALTVAATRTAERIATASPGGRLPVPMLCPLDEAANVVRWSQLPSLYSHFGSRGIIIMTVLQSWSQGIGVWGERGMKLLESSSNAYIYGGNVREKEYLAQLVDLAGQYDRHARNVSRGGGRQSHSESTHVTREQIFTVADLAAWPRGRMLTFSAGNRPVIVEAVPWMDGSAP
ncbi:type IV secretory system conjugative DNA transfer family protein [Gordonia sp. (in: high G+C Gram-positive bacteria)]|uniref:type IV secretory system conjugative DNA transfer family protein n=1 Tax=Gordonia sp. (in: high G+C Gram-positive bacteria) TaxID=84139 RepID=UPI003C7912B9